MSVTPRHPSPPAKAQFSLRHDYPPYAVGVGDADFGVLLERLQVSEVSAVHYLCTERWAIPRRRATSDVFLCFTRGHGQVSVDGRDYRIAEGQMVHCRRGAFLAAATDPDEPFHVIILHLTATVGGAVAVSGILGFPDIFPLGRGHPVEVLLLEACRECALQPPGWERGLEALAVRLLLALVREFAPLFAPVRHARALADIHRLMPALEAMRADLVAPLPIPELARRCHLSPAQFRRVFRHVLGHAPVGYLRQLRMEEACRLLRLRDLTVEDVSAQVGYADPAFFTRTFTRLMGLPPGRYREQAGW
jgi:AraC-like DNA-binding protein/quercetin dioxygenase-like cupin family protein